MLRTTTTAAAMTYRSSGIGTSRRLHALWDTGVLEAAAIGNERAYALGLARSITPGEIATWSGGTPIDWANESYGVAKRLIYGAWPHAGPLPGDYVTMALPIVNEQLEKAGVRLAILLNNTLR
jgi:hypothetical protein